MVVWILFNQGNMTMAARVSLNDEILDELLGDSKSAEDLFGKDGLLKSLSKRLMERLLEAEMTSHLGYSKNDSDGINSGNSRNGKTKKQLKRVMVIFRSQYPEIVKVNLNPH